MMAEITSLDWNKWASVFQEGDVFALLALLNPSLLTALRLCMLHYPVPERKH